ncbi:hypothetical protein PDG61_11080 [Mycolicibacterium sp. BiH015]|uniref:hypothetical protein n=1 Tax=Mycolicibacterium sp. BiH015 TaxID=3018808 RepID=UPI0022E7DC43|nr:hypothetical protein [Mycolicibacterium sp. BiH015]MDA2891455.1 hypothetical protein [Mycolicibacterium sp. BiH015]
MPRRPCPGIVEGVAQHERDEALDRLPLPYSMALRLRDAGVDDAVIAECVGVEPEGLQALMEIAMAKLLAAGYHE